MSKTCGNTNPTVQIGGTFNVNGTDYTQADVICNQPKGHAGSHSWGPTPAHHTIVWGSGRG